MTDEDEKWMRMAIEVARSNGSDPSTSPLGSVIVLDGRVLAAERNQTHELPDATAHAEMMAIRRACEGTGEMELRGATLYSTLQPCGMCTMASIWSKVGRVVYGAEAADVHPMYFEARQVDTLDFVRKAYRDDIVIEGAACATSAQRCTTVPTRTCPWTSRPICDDQGNHMIDLPEVASAVPPSPRIMPSTG